MVFSSLPIYLDPSSHWQQQPNDGQAGVGINDRNPEHTQAVAGAGGGGKGLIRPGSMTERARLAKLPMPEAGLRCPRCESTNTKFCYFNNYSLSQPRHFCKTCRRYWTRGGAMRNVPVGGGFRRNKRRKGSGSKSPSTSKRQTASASASASTGGPPSLSCTTDILAHFPPPPQLLPFLPSHLHHLADYCAGLNFGGVQAEVAGTGGGSVSVDTDFQIGGGSRGGGAVDSGGFADDQWRLQQVQQFPFLGAAGAIDAPGVIYQFEGDQGVSPQLASVKLEDNQRLNLSRNFLGVPGNDQYWVGNAWTDHLSGFASSSTTHLL